MEAFRRRYLSWRHLGGGTCMEAFRRGYLPWRHLGGDTCHGGI